MPAKGSDAQGQFPGIAGQGLCIMGRFGGISAGHGLGIAGRAAMGAGQGLCIIGRFGGISAGHGFSGIGHCDIFWLQPQSDVV